MTNTNNYSRVALLIGVLSFVGCEYDDIDIQQLDLLGAEQIAVLSALDHIAGLPDNRGIVNEGGHAYEVSRVAIVTHAGVQSLRAAFRDRGWESVPAIQTRCADDVVTDCGTAMEPSTLVLEVHHVGSDSQGNEHLVNIVASRASTPPLDTMALDSAIAMVTRPGRLGTPADQEDIMSIYWDIVRSEGSEAPTFDLQSRGYMLRIRVGPDNDTSVIIESAWSFSKGSSAVQSMSCPNGSLLNVQSCQRMSLDSFITYSAGYSTGAPYQICAEASQAMSAVMDSWSSEIWITFVNGYGRRSISDPWERISGFHDDAGHAHAGIDRNMNDEGERQTALHESFHHFNTSWSETEVRNKVTLAERLCVRNPISFDTAV